MRVHPGFGSAFVLVALLAPAGGTAQQAPWPKTEWPVSTPEAQGLDAAPLRELEEGIRAGRFGHIDRLVVIRNGFMVQDGRFANDYRELSRGQRNALGCGIDACTGEEASDPYNYLHPDLHPYYRGRDVHSLQSVTKSVTSALIGVAIARGEIQGVEVPLLSFLQDYDLSRTDPRLRAATLEHLLEMRTGIEWHETDRPLDETNTTLQLERSQDWVQFTLDQPMDAAPGEKWVYSSGGSQLMSAVIRAATGRTADAYAQEHLFAPLGIRDFHWKLTPTGLPDTEGGLYLEGADLARIGLLYLRDGMWDGRRILPQGWAAASTEKRVENVNPAGHGYGYQWWRLDPPATTPVWAGNGFGGQFLVVMPEHDIVAVVQSWNLFTRPQAGILGGLVSALQRAASRSD